MAKRKPTMPFERSFTDPSRECPIWAGPARLSGNRLTVQLPQGDAHIEAPKSLLARIFDACDGSRSTAQILALHETALRPKIGAFLSELRSAGVLIDASLYTAAAQRFAWVPSPFGNAAERDLWKQVPVRFALLDEATAEDAGPAVITPLDAFVDRRSSVRTYGEGLLTEPALRSFLWLLSGVVSGGRDPKKASFPRRTIPSGGAVHSLRPILVLRKSVGKWAPGVYAVEYPAVRRVKLTRRRDEITWLPRAVSHPWYLTFATGMVFLVADHRLGAIKYRARAFQYLFIEAGAALQNAALAAPDLGLAMTVYGGYVDRFAAKQLELSAHDTIIASAIVGSAPTSVQLEQERGTPTAEFEWADAESNRYRMPFHLGRCSVEAHGEMLPPSWGRSADPWLAYVKAAVESLERLGFRSPRAIEQGRLRDWEHALDPRVLIRYSEAQYRDESFALRPFRADRVCGWVRGRSLANGAVTMVSAEQVYASNALRDLFPRSLAGFTEANSSGCAAHTDAEQALTFAVLELIERDAFMRSWLTQRAGTEIRRRSVPAELGRRIASLERLGCRVSAQALPSAWAPVTVVYAQHEGLHFTVVGAAARLTLHQALEAALDELETLAYVRLHDQDVAPLTPTDVTTPADHTSLYALRKYFRRADAVMAAPQSESFSTLSKISDGDRPVVQRFLESGHDVVTVDIAAPNSAVDQGRTPLFVVRAFIPGLVPISFGHNREPLGMVEKFDRRGRFPHPFP
jgi:ribosomal protein S12 methylthiotransferase accessory factor